MNSGTSIGIICNILYIPRQDFMKKYIILAVIALVVFRVGGGKMIGCAIARLTIDFETLSSDSRVVYEKGAEGLAKEIRVHY